MTQSADEHLELSKIFVPQARSNITLHVISSGRDLRIDLAVTSLVFTRKTDADGYRAIILGKFEPGDVALECDLEEDAVKVSASEAAR